MSGGPPLPVVWGSYEVCESCGFTRARLSQLLASERFPVPLGTVNKGRTAVWLADDVMRWQAEREQDPRRKRRLEAVRVYRRTGRIAEASRATGAKPDSVRKWLREIGEKTPREKTRDVKR